MLNKYLNGLSSHSPFAALRGMAEGFEAAVPGPLRDGARRARALVTGTPGGGTLFEELGFSYIGPVDGHYMAELPATLRAAKTRATGPVLIHAVTVKGKGYGPAETSADKYHGVAKFDVQSGAQAKAKSNAPAYTAVFGKALTDEATRDGRIVAVTAAMPSGTGPGHHGRAVSCPCRRPRHCRATCSDLFGGHGRLRAEAFRCDLFHLHSARL